MSRLLLILLHPRCRMASAHKRNLEAVPMVLEETVQQTATSRPNAASSQPPVRLERETMRLPSKAGNASCRISCVICLVVNARFHAQVQERSRRFCEGFAKGVDIGHERASL